MKYFLFLLLIIFTTFSCNSTKNNTADVLNSILTSGQKDVDIIDIGMDKKNQKKAIQIAVKFKKSISNHRKWYIKFINKIEKGKPLPYHPNFGITKEEYNFVLSSRNKMKLIKTGNGKLAISKEGDKILLKAVKNISYINNIKIDLEKNSIESKYGILSFKSNISASKHQAIGRWNGYVWDLNKSNVDLKKFNIKNINNKTKIVSIKIYIGSMEKNNRTLIGIKIRNVKNGKVFKADESLLLH